MYHTVQGRNDQVCWGPWFSDIELQLCNRYLSLVYNYINFDLGEHNYNGPVLLVYRYNSIIDPCVYIHFASVDCITRYENLILIVSILYRRCEGCGHWLGLMN